MESKQAVKVFLKNEMYPRFNFLRRRLFSIYPRFREVIVSDKGKLADLIHDGKKLLNQIEAAKDKLWGTIAIYITGDPSEITIPQIKSDFLVSTKGTEDFIVCKKPMNGKEFCEDIKNISEVPSVMIYVEKIGGGSTLKAFVNVASSLVPHLAPEDFDSCVLCTESCKEYVTLKHFHDTGILSETDSLGKLIQTCLEEKVVKVLQQMREFIRLYFPEVQSKDCPENRPLWLVVERSLGKVLNESRLKEELKELGDKKGVDSSMVWYLCRNLETEICLHLSAKHRIRPNIIHEYLCRTEFDETIKKYADQSQDFYKKNAMEVAEFCRELVKSLTGELEIFEAKIDKDLALVLGMLGKIEFEIAGVFRQAKLSKTLIPPIPKDLQKLILSVDGVHGCGFVYGKLVVNVKEDTNTDVRDIADKINVLMKDSYKNLMRNFVIQKIISTSDAGITYESGKSLRVKKTPNEGVNVGDVLTVDEHSYGTLGCFVEGKMNVDGDESDNYTSQMYALSCAHVFPMGCDNVVEVGRTEIKYDTFGLLSEDLTLYKEHIIDIAAIVVENSVQEKCNINLKNCDGFEGWGSILHEGDLNELIGTEVYKWGAMSDLTHGIIVSIDYHSTHGVETLDEEYNILIECLPYLSESEFSSKGDSGTVVCFENPDEEKVVALSMINGALYEKDTEKYLSTYSCHLHTNIEKLSRKTDINFRWYT